MEEHEKLLAIWAVGTSRSGSSSLSAGFASAARWLATIPGANPAAILEPSAQALMRRGDHENATLLLWDLGRTLTDSGSFEEAKSLFLRGARLQSRLFSPYCWLEVAALARRQGAFDEAERALDSAVAMLHPEDPQASTLLATCYGDRGQLQLELGLLNEAAESFAQERKAAEQSGGIPLVAAALHESHLMLAAQDWEGVRRVAKAAISDNRMGAAGPEPLRRWRIFEILGEIEDLRDREADLRSIEDRLAAELSTPGPLDESVRLSALETLATLALDRSDLAAAAARIEAAAAIADDLGDAAHRATVASLQMRAARMEAEAGNEAARASLPARLASYTEIVDAFGEQWKRIPFRLGGLGYLEYANRTRILGEWISSCVATEGEERGTRKALEGVLKAQALGSLARAENLPAGSLAEVQGALVAPGRGILLFVPAPGRSHAFAIDTDGVHYNALPASHRIEVAARSAAREVFRKPARGAVPHGDPLAALSKLLFPRSIAQRLEHWESVLLVGGELMGGVPFASLPVGGEPLGWTHRIEEAPSIPVALWLARRRASRAPRENLKEISLFVAPAISAAGRARWPGLPEFPDDLLGRLSRLGRWYDEASCHSGAEATARTLAQGSGSSRVLCIVAHGVYDSARSRPPGILLAAGDPREEGAVFSEDVERSAAPELAILASCGTSRAPLRRGDDGVQHLGGAYLRSGSDAVILTKADLDLSATCAFLEAFHEELRERGANPAAAMVAARRAVASRGSWEHPYYWGALQLWGLGEKPLFSPRPSKPQGALWVGAALGTVALGALLLFAFSGRSRARGRSPRT